jgi:hypothetical protein
MDFMYHGANCISVADKHTRIVVDDNLNQIGGKSVLTKSDVALFTNRVNSSFSDNAKLAFSTPGEYEVGDISILGIQAQPFMNDDSGVRSVMYKLSTSDLSILITGHILGDLTDDQKELIGNIDVMFVPVGNNGYTIDPQGALKLIKDIEPNIIIPTHYASNKLKYPIEQIKLEDALKELAMEVSESTPKLKLKASDLTDVTRLVVLEEV